MHKILILVVLVAGCGWHPAKSAASQRENSARHYMDLVCPHRKLRGVSCLNMECIAVSEDGTKFHLRCDTGGCSEEEPIDCSVRGEK